MRETIVTTVREGVAEFAADLAGALPRLLAGAVFLIVAALVVKVLLVLLRRALRRFAPGEENLMYRRFISGVVTAFLWFSVGLSFLTILGMEQVAAALGTASGFLALGVSYALKDIIADAVAGVYLLRDPDLNPGDTVKVDGFTGTVEQIDLRKTRFDVDGDTVVRANTDVEPAWRTVDEE